MIKGERGGSICNRRREDGWLFPHANRLSRPMWVGRTACLGWIPEVRGGRLGAGGETLLGRWEEWRKDCLPCDRLSKPMWSVVRRRLVGLVFQCEWADGEGLLFVDVKRSEKGPLSTRSAIKPMWPVVRGSLG